MTENERRIDQNYVDYKADLAHSIFVGARCDLHKIKGNMDENLYRFSKPRDYALNCLEMLCTYRSRLGYYLSIFYTKWKNYKKYLGIGIRRVDAHIQKNYEWYVNRVDIIVQ